MVAVATPPVASAPAVPATPAKKPGGLDALRKLAKPAGKSSKKTTPVVNVPDMGPTIAAWLETKRLKDAYESQMATHAAQLRAAAEEHRVRLSTAAGECLSTVKLVGDAAGQSVSCSVTQTSKYCKLAQEKPEQQERVQQLTEAFTDDAPRYFAEQLDLSISDEARDADDYQTFLAGLVDLLMGHYGEEEFGRRFKVTQTFSPTKAFHHARSTNPKVAALAAPFLADETIKPYAASVKE